MEEELIYVMTKALNRAFTTEISEEVYEKLIDSVD